MNRIILAITAAFFSGVGNSGMRRRLEEYNDTLHQVLDMAVDDNYIRTNPSDNVLKELKQSHVFKTEKRRG